MRPTLLPIKFLDIKTATGPEGRPCGSTPSWDPTAYGRFSGERSRPFADLVAQVRTRRPAARRRPGLWPRPADADPGRAVAERAGRRRRLLRGDARVGAAARPRRAGRVGAVRPEGVGPRLAGPGPRRHGHELDPAVGARATSTCSTPGSRPSPRAAGSRCRCPATSTPRATALMRETAEHHDRAGELAAALDLPAVGEPATYLRYLSRLGCTVDAWETTYLHVLDPDGEDENPVLDLGGGHRAAAGDRDPHRRRRSAPRSSTRTPPRSPRPTRARRRGCSSRSGGCSRWPARRRSPPEPAPTLPPDPGTSPGSGTVPVPR